MIRFTASSRSSSVFDGRGYLFHFDLYHRDGSIDSNIATVNVSMNALMRMGVNLNSNDDSDIVAVFNLFYDLVTRDDRYHLRESLTIGILEDHVFEPYPHVDSTIGIYGHQIVWFTE